MSVACAPIFAFETRSIESEIYNLKYVMSDVLTIANFSLNSLSSDKNAPSPLGLASLNSRPAVKL